MVGIGPFIPQKDTPFGEMEPGSLEMTLFLLAIIRLMLPKVLLPATTALGTIHSRGRELGHLSRRKCGNAESVTGKGAEEVCPLR